MDTTELLPDELIITVRALCNVKEWKIIKQKTDRIAELKCEVSQLADASIHEISLFPPMDGDQFYPYALRDDLPLGKLLEEHRTLHLLISENPEKFAPRRLVIVREPPKKPILDLTRVEEEDMRFVPKWIVEPYYNRFSRVRIPWDHPHVDQLLTSIAQELIDFSNYDDRPCRFPYHFELVLMKPDDPPADPYFRAGIRGLLAFFRHIQSNAHARHFHRIGFYAGKGVMGNMEEEPVLLTKEAMTRVDLLVADAMWEPVRT